VNPMWILLSLAVSRVTGGHQLVPEWAAITIIVVFDMLVVGYAYRRWGRRP